MKTMIITYFMIKNDNWLKKKNHTKNTHHATTMFYPKIFTKTYATLLVLLHFLSWFKRLNHITYYNYSTTALYEQKTEKLNAHPKVFFPILLLKLCRF